MSAAGQSGAGGSGQQPDLTHLQDNFNEQQAKITALKELVRQTDHSQSQEAAQEKVKNIAQRLNVLKSKATRSRMNTTADLDGSTSVDTDRTPDMSLDLSHNESSSISGTRSRAETPGSEKIQLLRQQMELNRRKMAERESSKRDIEVMVSQLKAKFDDTQQSLHRSAELGRSMGDLSSIGHSQSQSDRDRIRQLEAKVRILETELAEADGTSSHDNRVKQLETKILDLEETVKEKDSLIQARTQAVTLMTENLSMKGKNTVDLLEDTQQEMVKMQENFVDQEMSLKDDIALLNQRLTEREGKIANLEEVVDILETTRYDLTVKNAELLNQLNDVKEYSAKLEELNMLNQQLQNRIADLEQQQQQSQDHSTDSGELERENERLRAEIEKSKSLADCDLSEKFVELENSFAAQIAVVAELEEKLTEKTVELSVLQANYNVLDEKLQSSGPRSLFSSMAAETDEDATTQGEAIKLKAQLDEANKSQIKTKLKMKQMQKQMDSLKKASDQNRLILQLQEENQQLQQKVSDLQNQPNLDTDVVVVADDSDMGKKIQALELTCHNQTTAINLLEEQKVDLSEDLSETKAELDHLRAQMDAREFSTVKSEISSIELEEQLELHIQDKAQLTLQVEDLNEVVSNLKEQARKLKDEKVQLDNENHKLMEKLDKLSEKVSSAESIEILENLTHQERQEMESLGKKHEDTEESADLAQKIEMFTTERKEVLQNMERVKSENSELLSRIEELEDKERQLLSERDELKGKCVSLEESMATATTETKLLSEKVTLMEKQESDSSSAPGTPQKSNLNKETLRESLKTLETEVESYLKCKDKNGKLATSKKMAKQAKNCVTQFKELIESDTVDAAEDKSEIDRLQALLHESSSVTVVKEQLEEELRSVRTALMEANNAQEDMRGQISVLLGKLSQKDELLEEHETDTAKLLADIKQLQEEKSVQDNADVEELQALKAKTEKLQEELQIAQEEFVKVSHELTEAKRHGAAFEVEKGSMKELIEEQKKQLIEQLLEHEAELTEKLNRIQLLEEKLQSTANDLTSHQSEELQFKQDTIDTLNNQIMDLYKTMDGNANALLEKEDEIVYLKDLIENNNTRMADYDEKCAEYENKIHDLELKLREVEDKNSRAANATDDVKIGLEQRIQELEAIVQELDTKNKEQLEKLKKFAANLKKKVAQCNELEEELKKRPAGESSEKDELLRMRERQIEDSERKIHELEAKIQGMNEELNEREDEMATSEGACKEWMRKYEELERKIASQQSMEENNEKVVQLEQALAETNQLFLEKDETIKELTASKEELQEKITALNESMQVKAKEVEKCKIIIKKRMKEIKELKEAVPEKQSESAGQNFAQEEVIQTLRSQIQESEHSRANQEQMYQMKIQENALYIVSLEKDNHEMNAKIQKLEEGIATIEERRNSMEQKVNILGATLQVKASEFQEHEDVLVQRLSTLSAHDEVLMQQLTAIQQENEDLLESVQEHIKQEQSLEAKAANAESELHRLQTNVLVNLEQEVQQLNYQLSHDSQEQKKSAEDLKKKLQEKDKEIEDLENELSNQFVKFEDERRGLHEVHEKLIEDRDSQTEEVKQLRESLADLESVQRSTNEELDRLRSQCDSLSQDDDEIKEMRMQVVQDQMEIEHLKAQNLDLSQSHEQELDRLRCEIINLQENNHHVELLRADLEKFQRELVDKDQEIEKLLRQVDEEVKSSQSKSDLIDTLATKVHDINQKQLTDFNEFSASLNAVKSELAQKEHEMANLMGEISRNAQIISELQQQQQQTVIPSEEAEDLNELRRLLQEKDAEIANYQQRTLQLQMAASLSGGANANADPFATVSIPPPPQENVEEVKRDCEQRILAMEGTVQLAQERSQAIERDLMSLSEKYTETQSNLLEKDRDLQNLSMKFQETQTLCLERNSEVERLHRDLAELQEYLEREQSKQAVNELVQVAEQHVLAAVPVQEEVLVQRMAPSVQGEIQLPQRVDSLELDQLREALNRMQFVLAEKALELDMAMSRIRELEAERERVVTVKKVAEKQVAQVSPQQVPEGNNIPAFSTAQFFDPTPTTTSAASFFDRPPTAADLTGSIAQGGSSAPDVTDYDNRVPVEEEMIVPKKAYLCFPDAATENPENVQPDASSMTPNVDDSWGWNAEEAALEEQHHRMSYQEQTATPQISDQRLQQLEDKIQELELERDRQRNEIHEFQLKSAKLLKKLREYKAANENLTRQKSMESSNDMDQFIQEELKEQVRVLEARLKEDTEKKEKEQHDRETLGSRISQLTASNSRLTEMKQTQELEIERHLTEIRHLRSELQKMGDWDDEGKTKSVEVKPKASSGSDSQEELERRISDLSADNDELQAMLDEEKETSRKLEDRLQKMTESQNEQSGRRIEELEKELKESVDLIDRLTRDSQDIKVHLDRLAREHTEKINENTALQSQLQELATRNAEFANLREEQSRGDLEERLQNVMAEMEYKNSDNAQMRDKLASQLEALEVAEDNLKVKERIIENLTESVRELEEKLKELQSSSSSSVVDTEETVNYKQLCEELRDEKRSMEHELQVLNDQVLASLEMEDKMKATVLEFDLKQIEINELKSTIEQLKGGAGSNPPSSFSPSDHLQEVEQLRSQIDQLNQYWTESVEKRGNDVAESWKAHLEAVQQDYQQRIEALESQLEDLRRELLEKRGTTIENVQQEPPLIAILPTNENDGDVEAMKAVLESQEMEIVTLKEQLAIRSAEFAAISARLDPYGHRATSNMASVQPKLGKPTMGGGIVVPGGGASGISATGSGSGAKKREQNELDLALYMLHQRDMRCEELTHELLILLEERDTLQLKWSDCMRKLETSRRNEGSAPTTSAESSENNSPEKLVAAGGGEGGLIDGGGAVGDLDAKLQSIHEASVSRGKALREERDERLQQMAKLQQDIANIPQEAVSEIVGERFALAETNQSPSSVLMNWLWGKPGAKPDQ